MGEEAVEDLGRTLMSPRRIASGTAADEIRTRGLLRGRSADDAARSAEDAREFVEVGSQTMNRTDLGTARLGEIVRDKGLIHPGSLGAADMAGREVTSSFPLSRGLLKLGEKAWDVARHGRVRPGSYEDLSPTSYTLGDLFNRKRQLRFAEEGAVFGGLDALGRADLSESESAGDAWKRANRALLFGSGIGAAAGLGIGNIVNLGQYTRARIRRFKRGASSEEKTRDAITERTGVPAGLPTRTREENVARALTPGIEESSSRVFDPALSGDVARTLGDLRSRGASSIPREITAGADVLPTEPIRAGGLMAVGHDLAQANRDGLDELRNLFDEYLDEYGTRLVGDKLDDLSTKGIDTDRWLEREFGAGSIDDYLDQFRLQRENLSGKELFPPMPSLMEGIGDELDELLRLRRIRLGDAPRRPRVGASRFADDFDPDKPQFIGRLDRESPAAGHELQADLPATRRIAELLSRTEGEPTSLMSQAVQRHMPRSALVRGRPAERMTTFGEV